MTDKALDSPRRRRPMMLGQQTGLVVILVLLGALFTVKSPGFLSSFNLFVLGRSLAIDIVIGFSQMVVLATGGMNLSVGSIGVCVVMMGGYLMQVAGLPISIACALALILGGALGWLNGFTIAKSGVNSFVVTLASANLFSGAMLILTKATPLNALPRSVGGFGQMRIGGGWVSPMLAVAMGIGLALIVFYRYSVIGRQSLATGANQRAAEMSGVPVGRRIIGAHVLSGVLAGVAGLLTVARVGAAMPAVGGQDWLLPSFLGPVLGGAALAGGFVSVVGTTLGAALVTTIRSGLLVMGIGNFWLDLFLGLFLLAAVLLQRYRGSASPGRRSREA
jgi:ribose transport system permease protein